MTRQRNMKQVVQTAVVGALLHPFKMKLKKKMTKHRRDLLKETNLESSIEKHLLNIFLDKLSESR